MPHRNMGNVLEQLEAQRRKIGRSCGSCSLCCHVLGVDAPPDLVKPPDQWCQHCEPGRRRCMIYNRRPTPCREFGCMWLIDPQVGEHWFPLKSRIVINPIPQEDDDGFFVFEVDPLYPHGWLREPYFSEISEIALRYTDSFVRAGLRWFCLRPTVITDHPGFRLGADVERIVGKVGRRVHSVMGEFVWIETEPTDEARGRWRTPR